MFFLIKDIIKKCFRKCLENILEFRKILKIFEKKVFEIKETLHELKHLLKEKIVIDVVAPLKFEKGQISSIDVPEGSAAEQAKNILPTSRIVGAFHNVSAQDLLKPNKSIQSDVIICSDDDEAKSVTIALAEKINGIRGIDGGKLENSKYVEDFTALLLNINRIYKGHSSIKLSGI